MCRLICLAHRDVDAADFHTVEYGDFLNNERITDMTVS